MQTKPLTVLCAVLIWILASICALPDAISSQLEYIVLDNNKTIIVCTPFPDAVYGKENAKYMVVGKALVYYILPLCVIACFYILMAKRLHASAREMPGELQGGQGVAQARARKHVARMVLAFIIGEQKNSAPHRKNRRSYTSFGAREALNSNLGRFRSI